MIYLSKIFPDIFKLFCKFGFFIYFIGINIYKCYKNDYFSLLFIKYLSLFINFLIVIYILRNICYKA